jgi:hypothetical protein
VALRKTTYSEIIFPVCSVSENFSVFGSVIMEKSKRGKNGKIPKRAGLPDAHPQNREKFSKIGKFRDKCTQIRAKNSLIK